MPFGNVTRLVPEHGFGFIVDDSGLDWFFVSAGVRGGSLDQVWLGERVEFVSEWTPRGPRAADIHFDRSEMEGAASPSVPTSVVPASVEAGL